MNNIEFTVKRSEWLRGTDEGKLYTHENGTPERCCLGFLGLCLDLKDLQMEDTLFLNEHGITLEGLDRSKEEKFADVNDNSRISDVDREIKLTEMFANIGIKINFVD